MQLFKLDKYTRDCVICNAHEHAVVKHIVVDKIFNDFSKNHNSFFKLLCNKINLFYFTAGQLVTKGVKQIKKSKLLLL